MTKASATPGPGFEYRSRTTRIALALAVMLSLVVVASRSAQAQLKVLYTFTGQEDGGFPHSGVIQDTNGNLYGTTYAGGNLTCNSGKGCGVVYKLTRAGKETVLYSFVGVTYSAYPSALIMDAQGTSTAPQQKVVGPVDVLRTAAEPCSRSMRVARKPCCTASTAERTEE